MKISKSLLLALAAGTAATGMAFGQGQAAPEVVIDTATEAPLPLNYVPGFDSRANVLVYSTGTPSETGGFFSGGPNYPTPYASTCEDVNFVPGLGSSGNFLMNGISFGWLRSATGTSAAITMTFTIHDTFVPAGNPPFSGTQLSTFAYDINSTAGVGGIQFYPAPLALPAGAEYTQVDANCAVHVVVTQTDTGLPSAIYSPAWRGWTGLGAFEAGSSNPSLMLQTSVGQTLGPWLTWTNASGANQRALYLKLRGDVVFTPPVCTPIGGISDAGAILNVNPGNNVSWYCITLNGDATDDAGNTFDGQFFDIDTEGSTQDLSIGLYTQDGNRVALDADGGSGLNAQMSFGMGRRAAVGDGEQYDGRNGEIFAGTYYLAVAPAGAGFGPLGFAVTSANPLAGTNQVRFFTNTGGSPLAASVPPVNTFLGIVDGVNFVTTGASQPAAFRVAWYTFETCVDATDPTDYLDIQSVGALTDGQVYIFDSNGNLVATDDDSGAGFLPQFSFGQVSPDRPAIGDGLPFAGQNGSLPAGYYYMGVGLWPVDAKPITPELNGRWHLRGGSGSSLPQTMNFVPSWTACPTGNCPWSQGGCIADYNGSGGTPDDGDVAAFFDAWNAGDECADANGSGGTPDDGDVATFFDLWNAGGC